MIIIGCDYHPGFQQIAYVDTETGELQERALQHREEAEKFYRELAAQGLKVRVGMEASGHARWFERLLAELNVELWIGDAAEIRTKRVRKQKTDRQDAQLILKLMLKDDFPQIWVPSWENRDLRQLLWHRHRMVQARTRLMNQLQAVALNEGLRYKKRLWREAGRKQLEAFRLAPWASRRRHDLLELLDRLNPTIAELINSGSSLPDRPIQVIYRGDPSGTSYIWTEYLSKVSGEWKNRVGRGIEVKWPVGKPSAKGSGSLARLVMETPDSIGYVELTFALVKHLLFGSIRNEAGKFIKADLKSLSAAAASKAASIRGEDFRVSLTNASGESSYPVASFTWLLVPKTSVPAKHAALKRFLEWILTNGQGFAEDLGYARLPNELIRKELAAVTKL